MTKRPVDLQSTDGCHDNCGINGPRPAFDVENFSAPYLRQNPLSHDITQFESDTVATMEGCRGQYWQRDLCGETTGPFESLHECRVDRILRTISLRNSNLRDRISCLLWPDDLQGVFSNRRHLWRGPKLP